MQADLKHAHTLVQQGTALLGHGDTKQAKECFQMAMRILRDVKASTFERCRCINEMGMAMYRYGNMEESFDSFQKAYRILQKEQPESLLYAEVMSNVGTMLLRKEETVEEALELLEESLEVVRKLTPNSMELAGGYNNYAAMLNERGMFERALYFHKKALEIHERRSCSDAMSLATSLQSIRVALTHRSGEVSQEVLEFYARGCAVLEERARCSLILANSLNGIASMLDDRGQLADALDLRERAAIAQTNASLPDRSKLHHYIPPE